MPGPWSCVCAPYLLRALNSPRLSMQEQAYLAVNHRGLTVDSAAEVSCSRDALAAVCALRQRGMQLGTQAQSLP